MHDPLLDEAARLLELEPAHALEADRLYSRARRGAVDSLSLEAFIDSLRACPDRFTVLGGGTGALDDRCWNERERVQYQRALADAGAGAPVVALAERPGQPFGGVAMRPTVAPSRIVMADVRAAIEQIQGVPGGDDSLQDIAVRALQELQAVRRALPP